MRRDNKAAVRLGGECGDVLLDVGRIPNSEGGQLYSERRGSCFGRVEETHVGSSVGAEDESDSFGVGCNLFHQLEPFTSNRILEIGKAGEVLTGTCQTGRKAAANRVADEGEYDRYGARFLLKDP